MTLRSSLTGCSKNAFLLAFVLTFGSPAWAAELTVRVENAPPAGTLFFLIFDSANRFGDLRDPSRIEKKAADGRERYRIQNVPPGEYALLVYHDENNNGRIDRNFIGIPKEPIGYSNQYQPKGPPNYLRASFVLREGEERHFDVILDRPLGKRGRLGVGLGVVAQTSPYRDYSGGVYRPIPAVVYTGDRLQVYGPNVQFGLTGSGKLRLAAIGRYRIGAYEEDGSTFLSGMGDRKDTFMAGVALLAVLPGGLDVSTGYAHDVLDEIGGGELRAGLQKSFQIGVFRFSPNVGINWLSSKLSNHDFGVPSSKATRERPAYSIDSALSFEGGVGVFIEMTRDWLVILRSSVEFLDRDVVDSPIVSEDYIIKGFGFISYVF